MPNPSQLRAALESSPQGRGPRIDAHHHLWRYNEAEFGWLDESMAALRRDFLADDLCEALQSAKVDSAVCVQARQTLDETHWLLEQAEQNKSICGVVGWAPLEASDLAASLDLFSGRKKLVGLREIMQGRPQGYLDRAEFNRGIGELTARGLTYDILIYAQQLKETIRFIDRHPKQRFVLDHAAKPRIASGELEPWRANLIELAQRGNIVCKISGLVTEADWSTWTLDGLRPYLDVCVEAFGPSRLLAGSDWPVCLVASSYEYWWQVLAEYFADFNEGEVQRIFGGNAVDFYRLPIP
jgi:L-fuconolactonase